MDDTLAGEIWRNCRFRPLERTPDWIVKVIDVFPNDWRTKNSRDCPILKMSNYHMMVRGEVMRGRFRNSFVNPEPLWHNENSEVNIKLQDDAYLQERAQNSNPDSEYLVSFDRLESANFCRQYLLCETEDFKKAKRIACKLLNSIYWLRN
jgi:hypothetical protein